MNMPFQQFDLGQRKRGEVFRVTLSAGANVFLVDATNFAAFKRGGRFRYQGGLIKRSPHDFVIPANGRYHVVAHSWGLRNTARIGVQQLRSPGAMPAAAPNQVDMSSIAAGAAQFGGDGPPVAPEAKDYDVFVCHASEDKDDLVRPLAHALDERGLAVWYDEFELRIGSSLRRSIDTGLANSRFGVVVLSASFFGKGWSNYELDGLVTREVSSGGEQIILPIWHRVTKDEVAAYSPSLADKLARSTGDATVEEIAEEIASVVATG